VTNRTSTHNERPGRDWRLPGPGRNPLEVPTHDAELIDTMGDLLEDRQRAEQEWMTHYRQKGGE
jgi:hypothetical protein